MVSPSSIFLARRTVLKLILASSLPWDYDGDEGPEHWANLSTDYHTCKDGQHQSPIDITPRQATPSLVTFHYRPIPIDLLNNGRTIRQKASQGHLTLNSTPYDLVQFHFHTPSEHTQNGYRYPMELHLVHRHGPTDTLVVVGVWITPGATQGELARLETLLPPSGQFSRSPTEINPALLLPTNRQLVQYSGSLTTPPCSENVTWLMLTHPITASAHQLDIFSQRLGSNARPLQPSSVNREGSGLD